jgi:hypothetical protein
MVLLGAALAPVIHCSNWANRSIIFLLIKEWFKPRVQWSDGQSPFQLSKESLNAMSLAGKRAKSADG